MATRQHSADDGEIKGREKNKNTNDDNQNQNRNQETENNDQNTDEENQTRQEASASKSKTPKKRKEINFTSRTGESMWNSVDGLFNKIKRDLRLWNVKDIDKQDKDGKYKYSKFLREKYKKFSQVAKGIELGGKTISGLGQAATSGYNLGWGMK